KKIRDSGGDCTLVRAQEIESLTQEKVISFFNSARDQEYVALKKTLQSFLTKRKKSSAESAPSELERLTRQFRELREIDFFDSPRGHEVAMLLRRAEETPRKTLPRLDSKDYRGKNWQTRPRPEIDRVGSAWLICKFIDPEAKFVFASDPPLHPGIIPFDMLDVEFSHHDAFCTFETLIRRFDIDDKAVRKIGEMIHDADLDDAKFQRVECIGIDRVLKGWGKSPMTDQEILTAGFACFDGLYEFLQRR
ncbi:MAG TPA: chromate resistance protein ChrB domain-containing protein, partial [Chthoniobacterales bacterium]|nr:chromate resistance protein ChrB domain-containing protein [Chthoniobacterales bacterium]